MAVCVLAHDFSQEANERKIFFKDEGHGNTR